MQFKVANVKVSVKIQATPLDIVLELARANNILAKLYPNYIVLKAKYTFIIFKSSKKNNSNHINITKIPNISAISLAILEIESILKCVHFNLSVDNIIASSNLYKPLDLIEIVKQKSFDKIKYNNQKFPGLFITFSKGTAIIFHSGKIVIVGCKRISQIKCILKKIFAHI